ncbi:hypothetical protein PoB_005819800 [Plakobranchus ocellatus]|uniref:Uncharacterized protein n=1 Tax=Plakobranchus ocellatus TaxID=259542 RepID=A0AAV4CKR5_9GAST|nr:hypothetical protein PoB_005819800 [Plakobranchus ocellatus]
MSEQTRIFTTTLNHSFSRRRRCVYLVYTPGKIESCFGKGEAVSLKELCRRYNSGGRGGGGGGGNGDAGGGGNGGGGGGSSSRHVVGY